MFDFNVSVSYTHLDVYKRQVVFLLTDLVSFDNFTGDRSYLCLRFSLVHANVGLSLVSFHRLDIHLINIHCQNSEILLFRTITNIFETFDVQFRP